MSNAPLIILQARVTSSRLPAKILLPVAGYPLFVLAALRAKKTGIDLIVATSDEPSDDVICTAAAKFHLPVCRGSLNDVLGRFLEATNGQSEDRIIVRLTADNIFPDGDFIDELVTTLVASGEGYLATSSPKDGCPYGLSAEAFYLRHLREAGEVAEDFYDRDNVTPFIRRKYSKDIFRPSALSHDLSYARCTVDSLEDYLRVESIFSECADPVSVSFTDLCKQLQKTYPAIIASPWPREGARHSRLVLGTAQIGIRGYGGGHDSQGFDSGSSSALIHRALAHGITQFDTARDYGDAEKKIASSLGQNASWTNVITKIGAKNKSASQTLDLKMQLENEALHSLRALDRNSLDVLLLHDAELIQTNKQARLVLEELSSSGLAAKVGISVYTVEQAISALQLPFLKWLQIPFNLLDWRWFDESFQSALHARPDVIIQVRSIFLRGLLTDSGTTWPDKIAQYKNAALSVIKEAMAYYDTDSRLEAILAFAKQQSWIDAITVGVDSEQHLLEIIEADQKTNKRPQSEMMWLESAKRLPEQVLDPRKW